MFKRITKKARRFTKKYVNGAKGAVSIFLAILMVPFASIAAMLINAGRINSAVATFDEALCNASNSTLGTYDSFLRSRFSLMAIDQDVSTGGTAFGSTSSHYTADDLINDTFKYYMEKNVGTLSNTYQTTETSAAGLYPLSDNSVLMASVLQASKITVPTRLAIDWASLDDMLATLTKSLNMVGTLESMLGGGADVISCIDDLKNKQEKLEQKIDDCNKARTRYNEAYSSFCTAAGEFNALVDNICSAQQRVNQKQAEVNRLESEVSDLERQIREKEEKIKEYKADGEDGEEKHKDEIEKLEKEIEDLNKQIEAKSPGYLKAKRELSSAQNTLQYYKNQYSSVRINLINKKDDYYNKIVALRDAIGSVKSAAVSFQDAAKSLVNKSQTVIADTVSFGVQVAQSNNQERQNELQQESDECVLQAYLAEKDGYPEYVDNFYWIKQENDSTIINLKEDSRELANAQKIVNSALNSAKKVNSGLVEFADRNLETEYQTIYIALDQLRLNVSNRTVPEGYSSYTYADLYYEVTNPIETSQVTEIIENIEKEMESSAGWAMLKAVVSFVKALFDIKFAYDPELAVTIDESIYAPNGGLPSKIDRSVYSIDSPYQEEDEELSDYYKTLLNSYSTEEIYATEVDAPSSFERMKGYFDDLLDALNNFKLRRLGEIFSLSKNVLKELSNMSLGEFAGGFGKSMRDKALLVGYISYNTANRTTYGGSALTGASFGLPLTEAADGYVFSGAETEYIYNGSLSEKENQTAVFRNLWFQRMILSLPAILGDNTIRTLASGVAAVTFGAGYLIVYAIFIAAEGLIDSIILSNGGTIPIFKSVVYLSPRGIPRLLRALTSLTLSKSLQQTIYEGAVSATVKIEDQMEKESEGGYARYDDYYPRFSEYNAENEAMDKKFSNVFTFDYTKSVQLLMLLFRRSSTMLSRLADIIEMECAYNAKKDKGNYLFNLDKSYTYLRGSGSFTSNVFIKIGEDDDLTSNKRVIYNGY